MIKAQCLGFLNTPPIWEKTQFDIPQFEFPRVDWPSFHPQPIPTNIRLGHQMEYVFKQLLEQSSTYQILLHNLPIRQGEKTLGEIDFILKDKTQEQFIHVELTYKFYLFDPEIAAPRQQLIGPNKRDLFYAKMEKIKQKQFPLLHTAAGIQALQDHQIDHLKVRHQCCFKAQLFVPFGSKAVDLGVLNEKSIAGYWLRLADFNQAEFAKAQFYMPTKSEWVIEPTEEVLWKSFTEMKDDIEQMHFQEKAPMIWLKKDNGKMEKFFVVWC